MAITASVADYLEAIMMLQREKTHVRSIDIANHFGYSRPTVSQTLKSFRAKGYVEVDEDGHVCLTDLGKEIAQTTYEKHVVGQYHEVRCHTVRINIPYSYLH